MPKNILTDAEVKLTGHLSEKKYPETFNLSDSMTKKMIKNSLLLQMLSTSLLMMLLIFIKRGG